MNPNILPNNGTNVRLMSPSSNSGHPGATGIYSPINPPIRPRMDPLNFTGKLENNSNQPNYQPYQNNPLQYQQMQQNNQHIRPNITQQRLQQNPKFPSSEEPAKPQTNFNPNFRPRGPEVSFESQHVPVATSRLPNPQQLIRPPFNSSSEVPFKQSNLPNQSQRVEPPKAPIDRPSLNHQSSFSNKTEVVNHSSNLTPTSSHVKPDTSNVQGYSQMQRENEKPLPLGKDESISGSNESIESIKSENSYSKNDNKISSKDTKIKEKSKKEDKISILKDDGIASGMVKKNINFFEKNDTAKTPLMPKSIVNEIENKTTKTSSRLTKNEFERGVDETPVVHPNLRSIFQNPRKVAKIPFVKNNKRFLKFKTKHFPGETSTNKRYKTLKFSQFTKPSYSHSYKPNIQKSKNVKIYSPEEELLSFFENTKAWRKFNSYESKTKENATKDKIVYKPTSNGDIPTPKKTPSKLQTPSKKNPPTSPVKIPLKSPGTPGTPAAKSLPKTPESPAPPTPLIKKVPMNKIQVGAAPSPNLKVVKSKVGSLANTTHKPGGGNVKIESHKIDLTNVQPRTEAKNDQYKPSGGDKKIQQVKLQWSAKSKVGSLENATYKPGGGDKKIESVKLDFKEKAKSKVGSKDNVKHVPGGGNVKIENQKLEFKAQSKVGSLDNVKHKPGGGDIKIFDDKTYLRQISGNSSEGRASGTQAYKNFSIEREIKSRSAPDTPRRKTSIKLKKITMLENSEEDSKVKKITEVVVTSEIPKADIEFSNSSTKLHVTYSNSKSERVEGPVELIKTPAKPEAHVFKPSSSEKDIINEFEEGKQFKRNENNVSFENKAKSEKMQNQEIFGQISESPDLLQDKFNIRENSKFWQAEQQEKIEKMWRDKNVSGMSNLPKTRLHEEKRIDGTENLSISGNHHEQYKFPSSDAKSNIQIINSDRNVMYNQNFPQNPSFSQSHVQSSQHSPLPKEYKILDSERSQFQVLNSFKKLHRTRQSVFKNDRRVLESARKEINDNYRKNKNISDVDEIKNLIKFADAVNYELKTTVYELEETTPGTYRYPFI